MALGAVWQRTVNIHTSVHPYGRGVVIIPAWKAAESSIAGAGQGIFLLEDVPRGAVLVAPTEVMDHNLLRRSAMDRFAEGSPEQQSCVRWFEDMYAVDPTWTEEALINHSFTPNGLWHLGFVFAARPIASGEELTVDYSLLMDSDEQELFRDSASGKPITGTPWPEALCRSMRALLEIFEERQ